MIYIDAVSYKPSWLHTEEKPQACGSREIDVRRQVVTAIYFWTKGGSLLEQAVI